MMMMMMDGDYDDDIRGWLTTAVEVVMVWLGFEIGAVVADGGGGGRWGRWWWCYREKGVNEEGVDLGYDGGGELCSEIESDFVQKSDVSFGEINEKENERRIVVAGDS
ncbi:hypothetical protein Hdeb2414_s0013g00416531 [Helianthus debilis subsp. tardiflorus]